jgi:MYXO-CTERM domain-containing protein
MNMRWMVMVGPALALMAALPGRAAAASASCDSTEGSCDVSNDGSDSISCLCADGSGGGGEGGNEWAGLSSEELEAVCEEELAVFCGPPPPPTGVPCETDNGSCTIDNEPDSISCECADGSGVAGGGGNLWDGYDDDQLYDECVAQADSLCGPVVPPTWDCENAFGGCDISFDEDAGYSCGCAGGGGGGGPGEDGWADLDDDELQEVCFELISDTCGGPPPATTGESESSSEGTTDSTETGHDTGTSDTEATDTGATEVTDTGATGDTDPGTTGDESTGATMTGNDDDSDSLTGATMTGVSATAGDDTSESSGATGAGEDDGGGCSCDASGRDRSGLLGIGLLGLLGLRSRRRR